MGYHRFQIGCLFSEFDLSKPTTFIQNCIYINFCINLTKLYINFSRYSDMIFRGRDRELKWLAFSIHPLSFFLYSPFKRLGHSFPTGSSVTTYNLFLAQSFQPFWWDWIQACRLTDESFFNNFPKRIKTIFLQSRQKVKYRFIFVCLSRV